MTSTEAGPVDPADLTIVPANEATWADLAAVFGACSWDQATDEQRRAQLRDQANCDDPEATGPTGLVAYLTKGRVPVGWVAVQPRTEYPRLLWLPTVWKGRSGEDKQDEGVWSVTCFVVREGYRRRGISYALAAATVGYARENGARALEGYAMRTKPGRDITWGELHVGAVQVFADAGFAEVSSPSVRRAVMRVGFDRQKSKRHANPD